MFSASIVGLWAYTTNEQSSHLMENLSTRNRELACEPIAAHASAIPRFSDMQPYSSALVAFWLLLFTTIAGVTSYLAMFTGFSAYDDEGALMITVKQYLSGRTIYVDVFSFYGPVYYLYN